jgi:hypothetical protein
MQWIQAINIDTDVFPHHHLDFRHTLGPDDRHPMLTNMHSSHNACKVWKLLNPVLDNLWVTPLEPASCKQRVEKLDILTTTTEHMRSNGERVHHLPWQFPHWQGQRDETTWGQWPDGTSDMFHGWSPTVESVQQAENQSNGEVQ